MLENWTAFLLEAGALIEDGVVQHFGNPENEMLALTAGNICVDLSNISLVRVTGNDAMTFLQGQLTNDIQLLNENKSQLNAYCNPKGRMLAVSRLFMRDGAYILRLPSSIRDQIMTRLRIYILRSNVVLESMDAELQCIGFAGPDAGRILCEKLGKVPETTDSTLLHDTLTTLRLPGPQPRFEIAGPATAVKKLWNDMKNNTVAVGAWAWAWLDIIAGIPTVYPETSEVFVPQMTNLELVGGVNFEKGCYTGQEIIARMHYLGKLKQRMYRAYVTTDTIPKAGEAIYADYAPDQSRGTVVDAQPSSHGGYDMLAVIYIDSVKSKDLHLGNTDGPRLSIKDLPYSVTAST